MSKIIDARGLEPPQPFQLAMAALVDLPSGQTLTLVLDRMPYPLLRILDRNGYTHESRVSDDGVVEIRISNP